MVDAGAIFKLQRGGILVGDRRLRLCREQGIVQVLARPGSPHGTLDRFDASERIGPGKCEGRRRIGFCKAEEQDLQQADALLVVRNPVGFVNQVLDLPGTGASGDRVQGGRAGEFRRQRDDLFDARQAGILLAAVFFGGRQLHLWYVCDVADDRRGCVRWPESLGGEHRENADENAANEGGYYPGHNRSPWLGFPPVSPFYTLPKRSRTGDC